MTSREVDRAARQWADAQQAQIAASRGGKFPATVTSTSPVQVSWRGATITATKVLPSYTPGVGDRVMCEIVSDQLVILG